MSLMCLSRTITFKLLHMNCLCVAHDLFFFIKRVLIKVLDDKRYWSEVGLGPRCGDIEVCDVKTEFGSIIFLGSDDRCNIIINLDKINYISLLS